MDGDHRLPDDDDSTGHRSGEGSRGEAGPDGVTSRNRGGVPPPSPPGDSPQDGSPKGKNRLTLYIAVSIVAAIGVALLFPNAATRLHVGGEIFLRLLKMVVVPLVVASVMNGILGVGDIRKLGRPGGHAILYYLTTTLAAVVVGLIVVNLVQPGAGVTSPLTSEGPGPEPVLLEALAKDTGLPPADIVSVFPQLKKGLEAAQPTVWTILTNLLLMLFTDNLFGSALRTDLLPLIAFSIIFAGMLSTMGKRVRTLTDMISQVNDALMSFVLLLMKVAPAGIFCLVAARFGEAQASGTFVQELLRIGQYVIVVLAGLAIHAFITLPAVYYLVRRRNPYRFMLRMSEALLTAFSTASSSATLPVTMECAHVKAGVSRRSTNFVLPLGATINMDGTALYEAVAAIFIAQVVGMDLTFTSQVTVAITATLAAIGAAGIPEAGLVTMIIVLHAVGLPVEYISIILSVDWLLDRFRTAVNVFGDAVGSAVVEPSFNT